MSARAARAPVLMARGGAALLILAPVGCSPAESAAGIEVQAAQLDELLGDIDDAAESGRLDPTVAEFAARLRPQDLADIIQVARDSATVMQSAETPPLPDASSRLLARFGDLEFFNRLAAAPGEGAVAIGAAGPAGAAQPLLFTEIDPICGTACVATIATAIATDQAISRRRQLSPLPALVSVFQSSEELGELLAECAMGTDLCTGEALGEAMTDLGLAQLSAMATPIKKVFKVTIVGIGLLRLGRQIVLDAPDWVADCERLQASQECSGGGSTGGGEAGDSCRTDADCSLETECFNEVCVGSGALRVSLSWIAVTDLDLHLVTPGGGEIFWGQRSADGGTLDVDDCVGSVCRASTHVENIVFANTAPDGTYQVIVENFNGASTAAFDVVVAGAVSRSFSGSVPAEQGVSRTFDFSL